MRRTTASDDLGVLVRSHRVRRLIASYRLTHFVANCNLTEVRRGYGFTRSGVLQQEAAANGSHAMVQLLL